MIKESFNRDGYVVIPGLLNAAQVLQSLEHWDRLAADPKVSKFLDDENDLSTLKALHDIDKHEPFFHDLFHDPKLIEQFSDLAGTAVAAIYGETFRKAPRIGGETPPHQDQVYHMRNINAKAEDPVLALWIALDQVDEGNSCLRYVPGSHLQGIRPYSTTKVHGFSLGMTDYGPEDEDNIVAICVEPGDAIVHHALTIHRTDANKSDRERRALVCNYVPVGLMPKED